ncbi:putative RNA-binding protein 18, partial [Cucurbita argyrosperma subsp. argyrosperma]
KFSCSSLESSLAWAEICCEVQKNPYTFVELNLLIGSLMVMIISEDFLWHTRGPKRGEPRGFAFIEYSSKEEAKLAKENMHGKLACSRPLVVRLASEKLVINTTNNNNTSRAAGETSKSRPSGSNYGHMSRSDKIAAIKNKLRALEGGEGERSGVKKQKQG